MDGIVLLHIYSFTFNLLLCSEWLQWMFNVMLLSKKLWGLSQGRCYYSFGLSGPESNNNQRVIGCRKQESPAIADKPARRESLPKIAPIRRAYNVVADNTMTILAYLHAFSCCCVRNLRYPEKFTQNSNLLSSRSSKVIDLGANRKPICDLLLVINSDFSRNCYRFRDIHG